MDDQRKYFFKVMLDDFQRRMFGTREAEIQCISLVRPASTVPNKFARHFGDKIQGKIKLKVCNGSTFIVVVARYLNKLVLEAGWEAFVSTHDIKMGDFLVFRYIGNFLFEVLIFDPSCCVKALPDAAGNMYNNVKQKHIDPIEISSDSDEHQPSQSQRSERSASIQSEGSRRNNKKTNLNSSTSHLSELESADDSFSEDDQERTVTRYMFSSTAHLTRMQWVKVEKKVRTLCSDIPIYGTVMIKTNISRRHSYLGFHQKYAEQYLPRENQILRLQRHGKVWRLTFLITKRKQPVRVSHGWKEFASDNNLQIGDICLFEQLKNKKMLTMIAHIIRK